MNEPDSNVVPFPSRGGETDPQAAARREVAAERGRRTKQEAERRQAVLSASASRIREYVATFKGKLTFDQRLGLAANLGRLLFGDSKTRKRGWLTQLLVAADISKEEDHTKRLPRYVIREGRKPSSPKNLAAKPAKYVHIAQAFAEREQLDPDKTLVELFKGVPIGDANEDASAGVELIDYLPLYRLLTALADGAVKRTNVTDYFRDLAKRRWITGVDLLRRGSSYIISELDQAWYEEGYPVSLDFLKKQMSEPDPLDPAGLFYKDYPETFDPLDRWHSDRHPFEPYPDEPGFYQQRLSLLPKLLLDDELRWSFQLGSVSHIQATFAPDVEDAALQFDNLHAQVSIGTWLVLVPAGPNNAVTPHLARLCRLGVHGQCDMGGDRLDVSSSAVPAPFYIEPGDKWVLNLGFRVNENCYVMMRAEPVENPPFILPLDDSTRAAIAAHCSVEGNRQDSGLVPVTLSNVARHLGRPMEPDYFSDVMWDGPIAAAPLKTIAYAIEVMLRSLPSFDYQKDLIADIERLSECMTVEMANLKDALDAEERALRARLRNTGTEEQETEDDR